MIPFFKQASFSIAPKISMKNTERVKAKGKVVAVVTLLRFTLLIAILELF
jgi:hypothetical protein